MSAAEADRQLLVECRCGDLTHIAALWFDREDEEFGDYEITHVLPWLPLRYRLEQAWRVLRGQVGHTAFVNIERVDVERVVTHMQSYLASRNARVAVQQSSVAAAPKVAFIDTSTPESFRPTVRGTAAIAPASQKRFGLSSNEADDPICVVWPAQPWRARLPGQDVTTQNVESSRVVDPHTPAEKEWRP